MKMKNSLPSVGVYRLAQHVATAYGFPLVNYGLVQKRYPERFPEPIVLHNGGNMMWVDRYYIATQKEGGDVVYHYLTRRHIAEEVSGYRHAAKARGIPNALPKDIKRAFKAALDYMSPHGTNLWINTEFAAEKRNRKTKAAKAKGCNGSSK